MRKRFQVEWIEAPRAPLIGWVLFGLAVLFVVAVGGILIFGGGEDEDPANDDPCPECYEDPVAALEPLPTTVLPLELAGAGWGAPAPTGTIYAS